MIVTHKLSQKETLEFLEHPDNWITIAAYGVHHLSYCGGGIRRGFIIWKGRRPYVVWSGGQRKEAVRAFNELVGSTYL